MLELSSTNLPQSRKINIKANKLKSWCISLTDRSILDGIAKHLSHLNLLSLFGIVTITDLTINALISSPLKYTLETFDINGCREVTQADE
jgi:hypothetical protein